MKFYSSSLLKIIRLSKFQWIAVGILAIVFLIWPAYWSQNNYNRQGVLPRLSVDGQDQPINWTAVYDLSKLDLNSQSALLVSADNSVIVGAKQPDKIQLLASLTKLASLRLVKDSRLNLTANVEVEPVSLINDWAAYVNNDEAVSQLPVKQVENLTVDQALTVSAVASANNAVLALVKKISPEVDNFVYKMNQVAVNLGLKQTVFADPTGLSPKNQSTAREMAALALWAWQDDFIRSIGAKPDIVVQTDKNSYRLLNTNQLTRISNWKIIASKTGHLNEAGYNLVMEVKDNQDRIYLLVLLGATSDKERQTDAAKIMSWLESVS